MANWGKTDNAANSVTWAPTLVKKAANSDNQTNLFGNNTVDAFVTGQKVGQFGVDTTEMGVSNGSIVSFTITSPGSGYSTNAAVTVSGNATANATANSSGKISAVNVNTAGSGYTSRPTVTIDPPAGKTFNANTGLYVTATFNSNADVTDASDFIAIASNPFVNGDIVLYTTDAGNTALTGLTNATSYYVVQANSTGIKLATTSGGANINITKSVTETGHNLTRTGFIEISSNPFTNGDVVTYTVAAGNTALTGLTNASSYYVRDANSSGLRLANTPGGNAITLVPGVSESGHTLTGQTATAVATVSGAAKKGFHAGWVLRKEGTGGRAGRVQYETLVAMGSITGDAEDTILKDS